MVAPTPPRHLIELILLPLNRRLFQMHNLLPYEPQPLRTHSLLLHPNYRLFHHIILQKPHLTPLLNLVRDLIFPGVLLSVFLLLRKVEPFVQLTSILFHFLKIQIILMGFRGLGV